MQKKYTKLDTKKKRKFLEVFFESLGNVTATCQEVGISRSAFYIWKNTDADFAKAVEDILEVQIDFVEDNLFDRVKKGSDACIIFFLKTKGKKRGYAEKQETINHNIDYATLTDEQLMQIVRGDDPLSIIGA